MMNVRLGFVPLTDCAPLVIARERGFFRDEGVDVVLSREASWANVRDKLAVGSLDGAQLLAPMSLSTSLGIDGVDVSLCVPLSLDLNGNAVTLSTALAQRIAHRLAGGPAGPLAAARALGALIESDRRDERPPLVFAVVFPFSSHNYMLRDWLASAGIDPDRDVRILVAPPSAMEAMLEQGAIDGYCVGEPWNALACVRGTGRTVATSHDVWPAFPEKVLALRDEWASRHPEAAQAVVRALLRACRWLDQVPNRVEAAHVIAGLSFVDAPVDVVARSLLDRSEDLFGRERIGSDLHVFHRHTATFPWRSHAAWFVAQMLRWGQLEKGGDLVATIERVYRPDLYREAAREFDLVAPTVDWKVEGAHAEPWSLETTTGAPIEMTADLFLDRLPFDPRRLRAYLAAVEFAGMHVPLDELPDSLVGTRDR